MIERTVQILTALTMMELIKISMTKMIESDVTMDCVILAL